jgi:hypothetical protein
MPKLWLYEAGVGRRTFGVTAFAEAAVAVRKRKFPATTCEFDEAWHIQHFQTCNSR